MIKLSALLFAVLSQAIKLEDDESITLEEGATLTINSSCGGTEYDADSTETVNPNLISDDGVWIPRCDRSVVTATHPMAIDLWCALNDVRQYPSDYIPAIRLQMSYKTDPDNEDRQYNPEYPDTFW